MGRNISETKNESSAQLVDVSCSYDESEKNLDGSSSTENKPSSQQSADMSILDAEEEDLEDEGECADTTHKSPPKKRRKSTAKSELGTSFTEILGNAFMLK